MEENATEIEVYTPTRTNLAEAWVDYRTGYEEDVFYKDPKGAIEAFERGMLAIESAAVQRAAERWGI